jgi:hypothetical protein
MNDPAKIAAEILQAQTRDQAELARMAGVPHLFAMMREIVHKAEASNCSTAKRSGQSSSSGNGASRNGLTERVIETIKILERDFTIPSVIERMQEDGFRFVGNPRFAVGGVFKRLAKPHRGLIRITKRGTGNDPAHKYEFVKSKAAAG